MRKFRIKQIIGGKPKSYEIYMPDYMNEEKLLEISKEADTYANLGMAGKISGETVGVEEIHDDSILSSEEVH